MPVIFHVGDFAVPTHEFFVGLGVLAALAIYAMQMRRRGEAHDDRLVWIAIGGLFFGAIFAKVSTAWQLLDEPGAGFAELWLHGGRSVLGGLAGAYVGVEVTKRIVGYRTSTGALFAPAVAAGMAIGRVGCFLTEQVGTPTTLPWGIVVPAERAASVPLCAGCAGVPLHPSFLYEVAFHLVAFAVLWSARGDLVRSGRVFKLYLFAYGAFRFGLEFVRGNPDMWGGMSGSQLFLLVTVPLLALHLARTRPRPATADMVTA